LQVVAAKYDESAASLSFLDELGGDGGIFRTA
jgi:hypothetical protein